jgi:hypothetical protein
MSHMAVRKPVSRVRQYKQFLRDAARDLRVKPSSEAAQSLATMRMTARMLREQVQMRLLNGQISNPDLLLKLEASLREYMPAAAADAAPLPRIRIEFAECLVGVCQKCGHVHQTDKPVPPSEPPSRRSFADAKPSPVPNNIVRLRGPA